VTAAAAAFIIPVLDEEAGIASLLRFLRAQFPESELVVVDGGSADRTVATAMPLCDQLLLGDRGRARQMNLGARAATAPYLVFLHADTRPGLAQAELKACLQQRPPWGFCRVRLSGGHPAFRVIEWCMNQRSRLTAVATGDQMLFVDRELFARTGGFDDIPLMEDVAYCKRLRRLGRPTVIRRPVLTSSRRWEEAGIAATVLRMWLLRLAFVCGISPVTLARQYHGR